jgi:hypothetical protein
MGKLPRTVVRGTVNEDRGIGTARKESRREAETITLTRQLSPSRERLHGLLQDAINELMRIGMQGKKDIK